MTTSSVPQSKDFSILVVCTGNICRSPALERILRSAVGPYSGIRIDSAGTSAVVGAPIHPPMADLLTRAGVDVSDFAARLLDARMIREADLVLGFTRAHRAAVVRLWPAAVRHSYTFLELARMLGAVDPRDVDRDIGTIAMPGERLAAAVTQAAAYRRTPGHTEPDEVEDPYEKPVGVYERVYSVIVENAHPFIRAAMR